MSLKQRVLSQLAAIGRGEGVIGRSRLGRVARTSATIIRDAGQWKDVSPRLLGMTLAELLDEVAPDRAVSQGPLRGLRFPSDESVGPIVPKLLGSYEFELHGVFEAVFAANHRTIVDIGCADGYYAVGLAVGSPNAHVIGYDIDPRARQLCAAMAAENDVADRVEIRGAIDRAGLLALADEHSTAFLLCDCEGFEAELFDAETASALSNWDVLIELHDVFVPGLSAQIRNAFESTHDVQMIHGMSAVQRAASFESANSLDFGPRDLEWLLCENRGTPQDWIWAVSRG